MKTSFGKTRTYKATFPKQAKLLKRIRKENDLTQQAVADHFNLTTAQYVSNIERGISPISPEMAGELATWLGADLSDFVLAATMDFQDNYAATAAKS